VPQAPSAAADAAMAVATIFLEWFTTRTSTIGGMWASPLAQAASANPGAWRALASAATHAQATANTLQVCTTPLQRVAWVRVTVTAAQRVDFAENLPTGLSR
jgi:hypothetical protein